MSPEGIKISDDPAIEEIPNDANGYNQLKQQLRDKYL